MNTRLEMVYLTNVLLYIQQETTLRYFRQVNKKAQDAIRCLKINPRSIYYSYDFLFNFFPHLNTLTGNLETLQHSLTKIQLDQITWIDCSNTLTLPEAYSLNILNKIITILVNIESLQFISQKCRNVRKVVINTDDDLTIPDVKFFRLQKFIVKNCTDKKLELNILQFAATNPEVFIGMLNYNNDDIDIADCLNTRFKIIQHVANSEEELKINTVFTDVKKALDISPITIKKLDLNTLNPEKMYKLKYLKATPTKPPTKISLKIEDNTAKVIDFSKYTSVDNIKLLFEKSVAVSLVLPVMSNPYLHELKVLNVMSKSDNPIDFVGCNGCENLTVIHIECNIKRIVINTHKKVHLVLINTSKSRASLYFQIAPNCKYCAIKGNFDLENISFNNTGMDSLFEFNGWESLQKVKFYIGNDVKRYQARVAAKRICDILGRIINIEFCGKENTINI
ncbi:hypothetical protein EIN_160970 [Entamoeba invadens IP1]|uniref:Uncharacterized protein n=1 Tax=Entamoeba invadens IP1 TaxID=370355 RepID=A0A0A1TYJ4_ENTIV|nr:hypothetical protein EIN_160970 [Entamoeba invadens IP1]ELP86543.1 hypothetical protein EIN_160970 [Entamoeba invadens IP1]|eukprot:XP_004185889.1 hypothetical protein EIN_160970 [Entamoeba invadens IP1]